jgi:hypothetical protein
MLKEKKYRFLFIYYFFPGLCVAFYATFLFKLIGLSIKREWNEEKADYNKRVSFYSGLVFIGLGISQALTGIIMSKIGERFCKFKLAVIGTLWV